MAGPGLLAHILVAKYCDHLAFYLQAQRDEREGSELNRGLLAERVGHRARLVRPPVEAFRARQLTSCPKNNGYPYVTALLKITLVPPGKTYHIFPAQPYNINRSPKSHVWHCRLIKGLLHIWARRSANC